MIVAFIGGFRAAHEGVSQMRCSELGAAPSMEVAVAIEHRDGVLGTEMTRLTVDPKRQIGGGGESSQSEHDRKSFRLSSSVSKQTPESNHLSIFQSI